MKESTLIGNHLAVQSVRRHSQMAVLGRAMKESTLMRNDSAAQSVTTNATNQAH